MNVSVADSANSSDKESKVLMLDAKDIMQKRWPDISTSVSGIAPEDWDTFKTAATARKTNMKSALEQSIADLATAVRSGGAIDWQAPKVASTRAIRIHADTLTIINELVAETGYRQNVVVATAMKRWLSAS
jgi:hypothetical protein